MLHVAQNEHVHILMHKFLFVGLIAKVVGTCTSASRPLRIDTISLLCTRVIV